MIHKVDTFMEIKTNWINNIYGEDNQEEIPTNTPEPLGKPMSVNVLVDASQAGGKMTYQSHTETIIYVNNTPIDWFSKRKTQLKLLYLVLINSGTDFHGKV